MKNINTISRNQRTTILKANPHLSKQPRNILTRKLNPKKLIDITDINLHLSRTQIRTLKLISPVIHQKRIDSPAHISKRSKHNINRNLKRIQISPRTLNKNIPCPLSNLPDIMRINDWRHRHDHTISINKNRILLPPLDNMRILPAGRMLQKNLITTQLLIILKRPEPYFILIISSKSHRKLNLIKRVKPDTALLPLSKKRHTKLLLELNNRPQLLIIKLKPAHNSANPVRPLFG